ncbi:MAG: hydroxyacid dehydrogenase [Chloroflexi bacterium]|nr:hydroxyacid dehydrogenase [Chloroflexota bacterium]
MSTGQQLAVFEAHPWEQEYLMARLRDVPLRCFSGPLDEQSAPDASEAQVVSVFIRSRLSRGVLDRLPNLRLIATRSTGFDHIDTEAAGERGIVVSNVPAYGENTVAEHTFGLILSLSRKILQAYQRTLRGHVSVESLEGFDLKGKTLGVVGAGRIGLHVIRIGRGFDMQVLTYDVRPQPLLAEVLGFTYVPLEELLPRSDIVSLHTPYLPQTHHLMNRERFGLMKRGALFINTARGGLVDTAALMWALDEGILAGAGLDVVEGEELVADEQRLLAEPGAEDQLRMLLRHHVLLRYENVILTPHIAFYSREAVQRILDTTVANIRGFLAGQPQNVVAGGVAP